MVAGLFAAGLKPVDLSCFLYEDLLGIGITKPIGMIKSFIYYLTNVIDLFCFASKRDFLYLSFTKLSKLKSTVSCGEMDITFVSK